MKSLARRVHPRLAVPEKNRKLKQREAAQKNKHKKPGLLIEFGTGEKSLTRLQ